MQTKIQTVPIYKQVPNGTKEVATYISFDGKEFKNKKDCSNHEATIEKIRKWNSIERNSEQEYDYFKLPMEWFRAKNNEELELLKKEFGWYDKHECFFFNDSKKSEGTKMIVDTWYGFVFEDGGDSPSFNMVYTKNYVLEQLNNWELSFPEK